MFTKAGYLWPGGVGWDISKPGAGTPFGWHYSDVSSSSRETLQYLEERLGRTDGCLEGPRQCQATPGLSPASLVPAWPGLFQNTLHPACPSFLFQAPNTHSLPGVSSSLVLCGAASPWQHPSLSPWKTSMQTMLFFKKAAFFSLKKKKKVHCRKLAKCVLLNEEEN